MYFVIDTHKCDHTEYHLFSVTKQSTQMRLNIIDLVDFYLLPSYIIDWQ